MSCLASSEPWVLNMTASRGMMRRRHDDTVPPSAIGDSSVEEVMSTLYQIQSDINDVICYLQMWSMPSPPPAMMEVVDINIESITCHQAATLQFQHSYSQVFKTTLRPDVAKTKNFIVYAHHDNRHKSFVEYVGKNFELHIGLVTMLLTVETDLKVVSHEYNESCESSHHGNDSSFSTSAVFRGSHLLAVIRPIEMITDSSMETFLHKTCVAFSGDNVVIPVQHILRPVTVYPVLSRRRVKPGFDADDKFMLFNY